MHTTKADGTTLRHKYQHAPRKVSRNPLNRRLGASKHEVPAFLDKKNSLVPAGNQTLDCPAHSVVPTPTTPNQMAVLDDHSIRCSIPEHQNSSLNLVSFNDACKMRPVAYI